MYYEVISSVIKQDKRGNDKRVNEKFLVENCEICANAEMKVLDYYSGENDCIAIKQSNIKEFVNERCDENQDIYLAQIEDTFLTDDGDEKVTKYVVGIFAFNIEDATQRVSEYMNMGLNDMELAYIKKTKIVDVLI